MPPGLTDAVEAVEGRVALVGPAGELVTASNAWRALAGDHPLVPSASDAYLDALSASESGQARRLADRLWGVLDGRRESGSYAYVADGEGRAFDVQYAAVDGDDGQYASVSLTTRQPRSEAAADLRLKERAMDEAPVGITISDPAFEDNPVVYANAAFERITDYPVEEVVGRNCRFLQGPDTDEERVAEMRRAVEEWDTTTVDVRNYRKDGTPFWNQVTIAPIHDETGEATHFVGFQRDVTERKRAERALETERDRIALLNQVVRHDIRNDMAVVLAWGEELRDRVDGEAADIVEQILRAARHTNDLTEAVGQLATLVGTDDPELEPVPLASVLRKEVERIRSKFDYRSQSITVRVDDLPTVDVLATSLLSSLFDNLFDNAVFHNDKSEVEIGVSVAVDEETVVVRIADNGPGIPDDRKSDVFGRGEKGLESPGSGLGLYLVDNLAATYGGDVWIEDADLGGSAFCVELRRA